MAECKECNKTIKTWEVIGGKCDACFKWSKRKKSEAQQELADQELEAIILTTETAPNLNIVSRVGIIMAEADCSVTVKMVENNHALQSKLRSEAYSIGANAVVGITFQMIETYSATLGVSKVNTFKLIASGTAVIIEEINHG
jgi:uncharacterized protein YbjQ (UPF0145 family)